jgi:phage-related protein
VIKFKILDTLIKNTFRVFKGETYGDIIHQAKQYNSGGEDYNPPNSTDCIATTLNNNDAETIVFLYHDNTARISNKGEKRIYSTDTENKEMKASVHLKNNGDIEIVSTNNITINATNNITINADTTTVNSTNATITSDNITLNGNCNLGSNDGSPVLTTNTQIIDGQGKTCAITNPATKVKAK